MLLTGLSAGGRLRHLTERFSHTPQLRPGVSTRPPPDPAAELEPRQTRVTPPAASAVPGPRRSISSDAGSRPEQTAADGARPLTDALRMALACGDTAAAEWSGPRPGECVSDVSDVELSGRYTRQQHAAALPVRLCCRPGAPPGALPAAATGRCRGPPLVGTLGLAPHCSRRGTAGRGAAPTQCPV